MKHTQGPWRIGLRRPDSDKFVYGPNGEEIANVDMLTQFEDVNLANARLIAAAPELLEALARVVDYHVPKINPLADAAILSATAAIKKARGE